MVWSAGQREFVPLLLGLYWLLPSSKVARRDHLKWVVIEELEMGLHPQAITAVLMIVLELLSRGYRVCLSTHSSQVLECVWALQFLKSNSAKPKEVLDLFGVRKTASTVSIAEDSLRKIFKVFYFDTSGKTRDISSLDAGSDESSESEWGGLAEFSSRANRVVAQVIQDRVVGQ
jgi:predicted ATPase